jgi:hypothetical protein
MAFKWTIPPSKAFPEMYDIYVRQKYYAIWDLCKRRAPDITNWMKQNALWTDRTGNARAGLETDVVLEVLYINLVLTIGRHPGGGTLAYGRRLELDYGGKYAIIGPAIDHWGPVLLADMKALMR